ncbi:MAG: CAP domain-containing protein [Candidatus Parcubacteria bacterium]|nr:CAP domain-containing protein [Candidatus Parcubacteria bacterium]
MLKDLFIPHEANDYQPKILHPKRLFFHGAAAVIIKIFVLMALLVLPSRAWLTPDVMTAESKEIIALTNELRQKLNLPMLQENALLNQAAYNKAQDMMVNQYFAHLSPENKNALNWIRGVGYSYAAVGENLAMGFSGAKEVFTAWTLSKTHNANLIDSDFKEIGVSMVSGVFKGHDTTMVTQYLAAPKIIEVQNISINNSKTEKTRSAVSIALVQGEKFIETEADNVPPHIDLEMTKIFVHQPVASKDKVLEVMAFLSADTVKAEVYYKNNIIELYPVENDVNKWSGSLIIPAAEKENLFNPVVLASLSAYDQAGNVSTADINWKNIEQIRPSLIRQYLYISQSNAQGVKSLVGASKIYFMILLLIAVISLALNVFIEIKKQHPHLIFSALGLIVMLVLLIIV